MLLTHAVNSLTLLHSLQYL